jgi:anaerobic selenocysteine-containing dehydrogenase
VHAGNPVLSAPNGSRIDRALPGLDLMVCFDFYLTETTRHADYILPPAGPLESPEYDVVLNLVSVSNNANYSPPMVDPPPGTRHDWEAVGGLTMRLLARGSRGRGGRIAGLLWGTALRRLGATGLLDVLLRTGPYGHTAGGVALLDRAFAGTPAAGVWRAAWRLARRGPLRAVLAPQPGPLPEGVPAGGLTLKVLERNPHGIDLGPLQPRLPERLYTRDKRIRLVDPMYAADLERLRSARPAPEGLVLIGRRHLRSNNSWMHNSRRLVKGRSRCTLMIHPDDAAARGLEDGSTAVVRSRAGQISVPVEVTDTLMPGVVSIPHGWGHDVDGVGWSVARAHAGVSVNDVTDDQLVDRLSGTSALNGVPVEVRAATPAEPEFATAGAT